MLTLFVLKMKKVTDMERRDRTELVTLMVNDSEGSIFITLVDSRGSRSRGGW